MRESNGSVLEAWTREALPSRPVDRSGEVEHA